MGSGGTSAPHTPRLWVALVVAAAVVLGGCRMELGVNVTVAEDGSGSVEVVVGVDQDGIDRIGGDLASVLQVDDLVAAGWVIDGPHVDSDGYTRVRFRHDFADPDQASEVFSSIAGDAGPFQDFAVSRDTAFARTRWTFTGQVDFSGGVAAFSDTVLATQLDGEPLGQSVDDIEAQLGAPLSRLIQVRVGVQLPGDVSSNATTKAANGAVWQVGFGEGPVDLSATGTQRRSATWIAVGTAIACAVLLLVYGLIRLAMRSTAKRQTAEATDAGGA